MNIKQILPDLLTREIPLKEALCFITEKKNTGIVLKFLKNYIENQEKSAFYLENETIYQNNENNFNFSFNNYKYGKSNIKKKNLIYNQQEIKNIDGK